MTAPSTACSLYSMRFLLDLLKTYIEQRDEMDSLKTEVTQLESQLDTLNDDLERKVQEYETCNGHS